MNVVAEQTQSRNELPAAAPRSVLSARSVRMAFGGNLAVDDVDLDLAPQQWLGLVGPNGSGKTTLLNVLSGVYRPTAGTILVDDHDVTHQRSQARARLGIARTFQHPQMAETLTIRENIMLGVDLARRRGGRRVDESALLAQAEALLDIFHCGRFADLLPAHTPYGTRKAAEIARAAIAGPRLLLLDEPAAGLSAEERVELIEALRAIRAANPTLAVCLVEHDLRLVASVCPDLVVLNFGHVIARGPAAEVLSKPEVKEAYLGSGSLNRVTPGAGR
ncbi:ATP-binding cassette domain-containing protein [Dactylosporangium sp. NPDC005572]|uniref:ABC transporter ATP-binding protein n=1 Tax=Dactylosporangium sp. NPDC005572 TaxID=3156889 RepID=UPI0033B5B1DE